MASEGRDKRGRGFVEERKETKERIISEGGENRGVVSREKKEEGEAELKE